jgi:plasmid stability protein
MATLSIRNLPDDVYAALRVRAAKHGKSMESEVREILANTVLAETDADEELTEKLAALQAWSAQVFAGAGESPVEQLIAERRDEVRRELQDSE